MDIKVSVYKGTASESFYRVGNSRANVTHREMLGRLFTDMKMEMEQATEHLAMIHGTHGQSTREAEETEDETQKAINGVHLLIQTLPPMARRLSQEAVDLIQEYIGWTADAQGNYQWFYRLGDTGRVWDVCANPIPAMTDLDKGRYVQFEKAWYKLYAANCVRAWVLYDSQDNATSELMGDLEILRLATKLLAPDKRVDLPEKSERWFLQWADDDFDPKKKPWDGPTKSPVMLLPSLRSDFDPASMKGWVAQAMKEDTERLQIRMPETLSNNSEVDSFTYFDIKGLCDGATPSWDLWIQSIHPTCRDIFMAAVFAPMHDKCRHRKLVWMRSQGYDGKSTFFNALNRFSGGKLTRSFGKHNITSDFGMESLIGARILLWGDSQHENALTTNVVHNITGGDLVTINKKNEKAIQYRFNSMLFVASNARPQLKTWAQNETSRLLYIPFIKPPKEALKQYVMTDENGELMYQSDGTPMFKGSDLEDKLVSEMPHILYKCAKMYKKYCPEPYKDLVIPAEVYDLMLEENEHEDGNTFAEFINKNLEFDESYVAPTKAIHDKLKRAAGQSGNFLFSEFFRYVEKNYGVDRRKALHEGNRVQCYLGMRLLGTTQTTMFDEEQ